VIFNFMS